MRYQENTAPVTVSQLDATKQVGFVARVESSVAQVNLTDSV